MIERILGLLTGIESTVSATTRAARAGETDGTHYHFLSRHAFQQAVAAGRFLEWVEYGGELYGTLHSEVDDRLANGLDVILEIELQGARRVRALRPEATAIFIAPPSLNELGRRLRGRGTETDESIARRLTIAEGEMAAAREFDAVVVNDDAERAAAETTALIERRRAPPVGDRPGAQQEEDLGQTPHRRAPGTR